MRNVASDKIGTVPFPSSLLLDPLQATCNHEGSGERASREASPVQASQPPAPRDEPLPLNMKELERRCMGRLDFAQRLLTSFETRFPIEAAEIAECLVKKDTERLARTIHQLKGTTANICAPVLNRILQRIENSVRSEQFAEAEQLLVELDDEWQRFAAYKRSLGTTP